jgi:methionyl-tRNA formyltransferase
MIKAGRLPITAETTASSLHDELAVLGAKLMVEVLKHPENAGTPQPAEGVTYAKKIDKAEAKIDFSKSAAEVRNHIHGLSPFPGAWVNVQEARVKVLVCEVVDQSGPAGTALDDRLTIACASKAIRLLKLQREAKGVMDAATFLRGFPVAKGTRLT